MVVDALQVLAELGHTQFEHFTGVRAPVRVMGVGVGGVESA